MMALFGFVAILTRVGVATESLSEHYTRPLTGWEERWTQDAATDHNVMGYDRSTGAMVGYETSTGRVFSRAPQPNHPPHMDLATAYIVAAKGSGVCQLLHNYVEPQWRFPPPASGIAVERRALWHVTAQTGWVAQMTSARIKSNAYGYDCECTMRPVKGRHRATPMRKITKCKSKAVGAKGCKALGRALMSQEAVVVVPAHRWASLVTNVGCKTAVVRALEDLKERERNREAASPLERHPRPSKGLILSNIKSAFATLDRVGPVSSVLYSTMMELAHASCAKDTTKTRIKPTIVPPCSGKHNKDLVDMLALPSTRFTPNNLNVTHVVVAALEHLCNVTSCIENRTHQTTHFAHCVALSLGGPEIEAAIGARRQQVVRGTDASAVSSLFGGVLAGKTVCEATEELGGRGKSLDTQADDAGVVIAASVRSVVNSVTTALATAEVAMAEWSRVSELQRQKKGSKLYNVAEDVCCCAKRHAVNVTQPPERGDLCESTTMRLLARYMKTM